MTSSSRRLVPVLVLAALLAALAVAPSASAKQKGFKYGVTAADVTPRSAIFWARTTKPGKAWLQLARNGKLGGCHPNRLPKGRGIKSKKKNDLTIQRQIGGLAADQGYDYRFCMKGGRYSATGHFVTAPRKSARTPIRFALAGDQDARAVPALGPHCRVIGPDSNPRRHLASRGQRNKQVATRQAIALGDRQRGRDHLRRHMRERRSMDVTHGDRGNEIAIQNCRAGERQPVAANDTALSGLGQPRRQGSELFRLLAAVPGDRACQGVQQHIFAVVSHLPRKIVVLQGRGKACQHLGDVCRHTILPYLGFLAGFPNSQAS